MRLVNTDTLKLEEFEGDIPLYAILSHRWGKDEVTFQDVQTGQAGKRGGYPKFEIACKTARFHGFDYIWNDTCCIDKTSSAELSESINSMYRWYQESGVCYAYLADVKSGVDCGYKPHKASPTWKDPCFRNSEWFGRGWTLQELIAPSAMIFYDHQWQDLGTKLGLCSIISEVTGIPEAILRGGPLSSASVAQKFSWAAARITTRIEDRAYSLMGLFGVNMPMLYGEGGRAFVRLQEEILKTSHDHSLFAWRDNITDTKSKLPRGLLSPSLNNFRGMENFALFGSTSITGTLREAIRLDSLGIHLSVFLGPMRLSGRRAAILCCRDKTWRHPKRRFVLWLQPVPPGNECFHIIPFYHWKSLNWDKFEEADYRLTDICVLRDQNSGDRVFSPVMAALAEGKDGLAKWMLEKGASPNGRGKFNEPLLATAYQHEGHNGPLVDLILKNGADVQGSSEYMLLSQAISQGQEEFAVSLLENGADPNNWFDRTPLGLAAEWGNEKLVKLLLCKGANASAPDRVDGRTPLSHAVINGSRETVIALLEGGAKPDWDLGGTTALQLATSRGEEDIAALLRQATQRDAKEKGVAQTGDPTDMVTGLEAPLATSSIAAQASEHQS